MVARRNRDKKEHCMKKQLVMTVDLDGAKGKFVAIEVRHDNKTYGTIVVDDKSVRYCKPRQRREDGLVYSIVEFVELMKNGKKM